MGDQFNPYHSLPSERISFALQNPLWSLPPSALLLHAAWHEAVFGPQNFKFKDREPTESERAHVAELKRISGAT